MFRFPAFLDPSLRFVLSVDGDPPPVDGGEGGGAPAGGGTAGGGDPPASNAARGEGDGAAAASGEQPPKPDWRDRQIDRQHRKIKELETQAAKSVELEAENQRLRELAAARTAPPPPPDGGDPAAPPAPAPAATPPRAAAPAAPANEAAIRAEERFKLQMENLQNEIAGRYKTEWEGTVYENFRKVGGLTNDLMDQVFATDDPAYVMIELGKDPGRIQEMLDLNGARRQAALIKIALGKPDPAKKAEGEPAGEKPSGAPPPPSGQRPGGGNAPAPGGGDLYADKYQMEKNPQADQLDAEWYAERARQKRESKGRPWSIQR